MQQAYEDRYAVIVHEYGRSMTTAGLTFAQAETLAAVVRQQALQEAHRRGGTGSAVWVEIVAETGCQAGACVRVRRGGAA